jgi:hypothetical protein
MASNTHHPKFPPSVILSEAKDLSGWAEMLRCAQHDHAGTTAASPECHPEHLRFTQCKLREGSSPNPGSFAA